MCCKVPGIAEVEKPPHKWCRHWDHGCTIYADRPKVCQEFECQWLRASPQVLPDSLRPDRTKVIFTADADNRLIAYCDANYPGAWRETRIIELLRRGAIATGHSIVRCGDRFWIVTRHTIYETVDVTLSEWGGFVVKVAYQNGVPAVDSGVIAAVHRPI